MHCTANCKRTGQACRNRPVRGRTVCRMHGGKTPRGIAHPSFKSGRYSKDLPTNLAARYEESLKSDSLKSLLDDLSLCDLRISELLSRIKEKGEPPESPIWKEILMTLDYRRKLLETDARQAMLRGQYISAEKAMAFVNALTSGVKDAVGKYTSPQVGRLILEAVRDKFSQLVGTSQTA